MHIITFIPAHTPPSPHALVVPTASPPLVISDTTKAMAENDYSYQADYKALHFKEVRLRKTCVFNR